MSNERRYLEPFRSSLYQAAARSLEREHPGYVNAYRKVLQATGDFRQALDAVKCIPTDPGFSKWRPLITAFFDTELAMNQVKSSLRLLKRIPDKGILNGFLMSEGAWVNYQVTTWIFWMDALLERTKKLVKECVRALVRPNTSEWKSVESELLSVINSLSEHTGKVRHPLAHGGGPVEAPADEHLWEGFVLNPGPIDFNHFHQSMAPFHALWYDRLFKSSALAVAAIDKAVHGLHCCIDWDKV